MSLALAELRRTFAASFSGRASTSCPDPSDLWDTIELRLPLERRHEIVDHLAECRICAESWRIALRMGATPSRWRRAARATRDAGDWFQPARLHGRPAVIAAVGSGMALGGFLSLFTGRPWAALALCLAGLWVRERGLRKSP